MVAKRPLCFVHCQVDYFMKNDKVAEKINLEVDQPREYGKVNCLQYLLSKIHFH